MVEFYSTYFNTLLLTLLTKFNLLCLTCNSESIKYRIYHYCYLNYTRNDI